MIIDHDTESNSQLIVDDLQQEPPEGGDVDVYIRPAADRLGFIGPLGPGLSFFVFFYSAGQEKTQKQWNECSRERIKVLKTQKKKKILIHSQVIQ